MKSIIFGASAVDIISAQSTQKRIPASNTAGWRQRLIVGALSQKQSSLSVLINKSTVEGISYF